jgi:hypothetical protein
VPYCLQGGAFFASVLKEAICRDRNDLITGTHSGGRLKLGRIA